MKYLLLTLLLAGPLYAPAQSAKDKDLEVLSKVWGFVKYYHPNVAAGKFNWDDALLRILPGILQAKTPEERNVQLLAWIKEAGTYTSGKKKIDTKNAVLVPDLDWLKDHQLLGSDLSEELQRIRDAARDGKHHYVAKQPGAGNPVFNNELPYADKPYPDSAYRLLALYRYWNMVQYFFPYKHLMDEKWNDVLPAFIPRFLAVSNEKEYQLTVLELISKVQDTHANIWRPMRGLDEYFGGRYTQADVTFIEDKPVIARTAANGLQKGDIILQVNNEAAPDMLKRLLPYCPASNHPTQLRDAGEKMLRTKDSIISVQIDRNGVTQILQIPSVKRDDYYAWKSAKQDTGWKLLSPQVGYIYPGNLRVDQVPRAMHDLYNTKGIVIDMRCYPKEFILYNICGYLIPKMRPFFKMSIVETGTPGLFIRYPGGYVGRKGFDSCYKGKIVILVNETTQSQAEFTTMALQQTPGSVVLGSTTAGADGNVSFLWLPGGIQTSFSGIGIYYPDDKETQRIGIVPDVKLQPTIKGFREGKDELLEKAMSILQ